MSAGQLARTDRRHGGAGIPFHLSTAVKCVPGGHQIPLSEAYWCSDCGWYICYKHLKKGTFTTAIHCPKGHSVKRAT